MSKQSTEQKALQATVRAMTRALKQDHNIDVSFTAMRAAVLQAQGENPHAFKKSTSAVAGPEIARLQKLIEEAPIYFHPGYDFEGRKLAWLVNAGLAGEGTGQGVDPSNGDSEQEEESPRVTRQLHLAPDEAGNLTRLALDSAGRFLLPDDWKFTEGTVSELTVQVPPLKVFGAPAYLADSKKFFKEKGLKLSKLLKPKVTQFQFDEPDTAVLDVQMSQSECTRMNSAAVQFNAGLVDEAGEWTALHYRMFLPSLTADSTSGWILRYLDSVEVEGEYLEVVFEWVYPDEDGDSLPAQLDLRTGEISFLDDAECPEDIFDRVIRTRIWEPELYDGEPWTVEARGFQWFLPASSLRLLNSEL